MGLDATEMPVYDSHRPTSQAKPAATVRFRYTSSFGFSVDRDKMKKQRIEGLEIF